MRLSPRIALGRLVVPILVLSLASAGCGSSAGTVSGKVYYKGAALKGGNVTFVTASKQSQLAEIQEDGSYKVEKIPVGAVTICVETASLKPTNQRIPNYQPPPGMEGNYKPPDNAARAKRYTAIPERYEDLEQSGLKYTVTSGGQEHDIKLE